MHGVDCLLWVFRLLAGLMFTALGVAGIMFGESRVMSFAVLGLGLFLIYAFVVLP